MGKKLKLYMNIIFIEEIDDYADDFVIENRFSFIDDNRPSPFMISGIQPIPREDKLTPHKENEEPMIEIRKKFIETWIFDSLTQNISIG